MLQLFDQKYSKNSSIVEYYYCHTPVCVITHKAEKAMKTSSIFVIVQIKGKLYTLCTIHWRDETNTGRNTECK